MPDETKNCDVSVADATRVLQTFIDAGLKNDVETMKACVTRKTLESGKLNSTTSEGMRFAVEPGRVEGDGVVIPLKAFPADAPADSPPAMEMDCLMVREDGRWKFDLDATVERMLGGPLGEVVEQMTSAMKDMMKGVGDALDQGLRAAFGDDKAPKEDKDK